MRFCLLLLFTSIVNAQSADLSNKAIPVTVKNLSDILLERKLSATAQTIAVNHSSISSQNSAVIEKIYFDVGDLVKEGQLIIELDQTDFYLSLKQAQANLSSVQAQIKQAQQRLKRAEDLIQKKYISDDDLLARHTDFDVLIAEERRLLIGVEKANRELSKTKIKAPFDAVINKRFANVGTLVTTGQALFELIQVDSPEIKAEIPDHITKSLKNANGIEYITNNESYKIQLIKLSQVIQNPTRTQVARFSFANDFKAKIGSSGQVIWTVKKSLLPADLVVRRYNKLGVFVVHGDRARFIELKYAQEGRPVPIDIDMLENTKVIVGGRERLQDGDSITETFAQL